MTELVFDAGALIALERGDRSVRAFVQLAGAGDVRIATSSAVVAQVWRGGARQARLARFLASDLFDELFLDDDASRRIGALAAALGTHDVVDGHVAVIALDRDARVVTSDPADLARWGIDPRRIVTV